MLKCHKTVRGVNINSNGLKVQSCKSKKHWWIIVYMFTLCEKLSLKLYDPTVHNFEVIYPSNLFVFFSEKVAYFLKVSITFPFYKQKFTAQ